MQLLLAARRERRRLELREMGEVTAFAFHQPEKLHEILKPSVAELAEKASTDPKAWDNDKWWLTEGYS